jgi:AAA+ superfamily predicted ATPase
MSYDEIVERVLNSDKNIFIHGKAGTGKSTIANHLSDKYGKKLLLTASTGCAASLIGGSTIHSILFRYKTAKKVSFTIILVDEISMVDGNLF